MTATNEIYGWIDDNGNVHLEHVDDGSVVTQLEVTPDHAWCPYPIGSSLSARYEHPGGLVVTHDDAVRLGIEIGERS